MESKNINNLKELRLAKAELKYKMKQSTDDIKDGFVFSTARKMFGKQSKANVLSTFVARKIGLSSKGNQSNKIKPILSTVAAVALPFIAKRAVRLLRKKIIGR